MGHYRFPAYERSLTARYLVITDAQRQVVQFEYLPPGADLRGGMNALLRRLAGERWTIEGGIEYGSVFVNRNGERHVVIITERHPHDSSATHFNPWRRG